MVWSRVRTLCHYRTSDGKSLRIAIGVVVVAFVRCGEVRAIVFCGCDPGICPPALGVSVCGFGLPAAVEAEPEEGEQEKES